MTKKTILYGALALLGLLTICLSGCALMDLITGTKSIAWSDDAQAYSSGAATAARYKFRLPSGGQEYTIWGTDTYTDDSSIGTAAVHAGLIAFASGGVVTIEMKPGSLNFTGSTRNGVTSLDRLVYSGTSFVFVQ